MNMWFNCYPRTSKHSFTFRCLFVTRQCPSWTFVLTFIVCVCVCVLQAFLPSLLHFVTVPRRATSSCETPTRTSSWTKATCRWRMATRPSPPTEPHLHPAVRDRRGAGGSMANAATARRRMLSSENWTHANTSSWAVARVSSSPSRTTLDPAPTHVPRLSTCAPYLHFLFIRSPLDAYNDSWRGMTMWRNKNGDDLGH